MATERESINSNAAIAGHPLHPMMIHFPVAALIGLVPADPATSDSRRVLVACCALAVRRRRDRRLDRQHRGCHRPGFSRSAARSPPGAMRSRR